MGGPQPLPIGFTPKPIKNEATPVRQKSADPARMGLHTFYIDFLVTFDVNAMLYVQFLFVCTVPLCTSNPFVCPVPLCVSSSDLYVPFLSICPAPFVCPVPLCMSDSNTNPARLRTQPRHSLDPTGFDRDST